MRWGQFVTVRFRKHFGGRGVLATESDFEWLWAKGFFAEINDRTGALLDDYEEEEIGVEHVVDVLRVATQFQSIRGLPPSVSTFLGNVADAVVLLTGRCLCSSFCDSRNSLGPPPAQPHQCDIAGHKSTWSTVQEVVEDAATVRANNIRIKGKRVEY